MAAAKTRRAARDTQAAIFQAATREFAEKGFDGAGVDRIAAKARVNKAMLYYHYGSKQGLYDVILRDVFRTVGARGRAIADGPGAAADKIDMWIVAVVEEASARPWFPPIMLRELASGGRHFDEETFALMNGVYAGVHDMIVQGQREGAFRDVDPLLTHLTLMPAILIYFARAQLLSSRTWAKGIAQPRGLDQFVRHIQAAMRGMLRKQT